MTHLQPLLSTTALLLALLGQGTALVHMGVVRHERCAEHGELVDVADFGASSHTRHHAVAESGVVQVDIGDGDGEHDGDDHCVLAFRVCSVPDVDGSVADVEPVAIFAEAVAGLRSAEGVVAHAVLDVAPKTSPPRA